MTDAEERWKIIKQTAIDFYTYYATCGTTHSNLRYGLRLLINKWLPEQQVLKEHPNSYNTLYWWGSEFAHYVVQTGEDYPLEDSFDTFKNRILEDAKAYTFTNP